MKKVLGMLVVLAICLIGASCDKVELEKKQIEIDNLKTQLQGIQNKMKPQILLDENTMIPPSHTQPFNYEIKNDCILDVEALETTGQNIEFKILQEGNLIYSSAIATKVIGLVKIGKGQTTINFINGNLADGKTVKIRITTYYYEKP